MNIFKKIFSIIAAVILFGKCYMIGYAGAEEAPRDIKLTCETKYIDIDEIPEDRMVKLAVSIDNNPGFQVLCVLIDIDPRLEFNTPIACEIIDFNDTSCINYTAPHKGETQIQFDIFSNINSTINRNDVIMDLVIKLPDEVKNGECYNVSILKEDINGYTCICLDRQGREYCSESFSELNIGGIHITDNQPVQEPETIPVQQNNVNHSDENTNNEHETSENNNSEVNNQKISNEITTVSSLLTTSPVSSSQISITTKPQTNTVTTITTKNTKPVTMVTTEQNKINSDEKTENKKGVNIIWLVIAAVLIISIGVSVLILIKRSKKDR